MKLQWYGHSTFLLTASDGTAVLTDPTSPRTGYVLHDIPCDAVTVSHGHDDHNYVAAASGKPVICDRAETYRVGDVTITGLPTCHDDRGGALRGGNIVFIVEMDGLRIVHLGDLGHMPTSETLTALGRVDVLLCPVGSVYTIDAQQADTLRRGLRPAVCVPMHYQTPQLTFPLGGVEEFLSLCDKDTLHRGGKTLTFTADTLPASAVCVPEMTACL